MPVFPTPPGPTPLVHDNDIIHDLVFSPENCSILKTEHVRTCTLKHAKKFD